MLVLTDDFAEKDLIGYDAYRDGLVEVIRSVESKGSFTIGIYGQWGTGKTSILKQIKAAFDNPISKDDKPVLTVWFNPWQFVADEHLIIPFFHTLIASLEKINTKSTTEKTNQLGNFLKKIAPVPLALVYGMEVGLKIPYLLDTKFLASKTIDYVEEKKDLFDKKNEQKDETAIQTAAKDYESTYYNLIKTLQDASAELDLKIVVFIDDLDRCLPEKAVQLLEGLKVLMDLPNFVFVLGVAKEVIERGIRVRYRELYLLGDQANDLRDIQIEYLDKIIQFPFTLPAPNTDKLKENILSPHIQELEVSEESVDLIHEVLGSNPRTLKRFINTISFSMYLAKKIFEDDSFHSKLVIKISLIGYLFPNLYKQLEEKPFDLVTLEEIVTEIEEDRINEEGEKTQDAQSHLDKKTGLSRLDQWLEEDKINKLLPILKIQEIGFKDEKTAVKYIRLIASSLESEVTSRVKETPIKNKSIDQYMPDRMVEIPPAKFTMGDDKSGRVEVEISHPFLMDKYPVTQDLYQEVMGKNPSYFSGEDLPVENINWFDAIEFCNKLSEQTGLERVYEGNDKNVEINYEKSGYRLPTEAEWEYACCGGTTDELYGNLDDIAWYIKNSKNQTQGVGLKEANEFGLYDMLGNVWEWCNDWYDKEYPKYPQKDPTGPENRFERLLRGGSWANFANNIWSTYRQRKDPYTRDNNLGIRLVRSLNQQMAEEL